MDIVKTRDAPARGGLVLESLDKFVDVEKWSLEGGGCCWALCYAARAWCRNRWDELSRRVSWCIF